MFKCSHPKPHHKVLSLVRTLGSVAVFFSLAVGGVAAKEYKLPHSADAQHPNHLALVEMAKRIAERTKMK